MLGVRYTGTDSYVSFDAGQILPPLPEVGLDVKTSGLGFMAAYDSRDDNYYPYSGQNFQASFTRNDEAIGSDYNYFTFNSNYQIYHSFFKKNVIAFKLDSQNADGGIPFFMEPTLKMRGFDTSKYRDKAALSLQAEWRYKFAKRWGMVAFLEAGSVASDFDKLADGRKVTSQGVGIRWQATKKKRINLGVDVAYADNNPTVYIRAGEAF